MGCVPPPMRPKAYWETEEEYKAALRKEKVRLQMRLRHMESSFTQTIVISAVGAASFLLFLLFLRM